MDNVFSALPFCIMWPTAFFVLDWQYVILVGKPPRTFSGVTIHGWARAAVLAYAIILWLRCLTPIHDWTPRGLVHHLIKPKYAWEEIESDYERLARQCEEGVQEEMA
jgi:hypothetical protein